MREQTSERKCWHRHTPDYHNSSTQKIWRIKKKTACKSTVKHRRHWLSEAKWSVGCFFMGFAHECSYSPSAIPSWNKTALISTAKNQSYNINWNDCKKSPKYHQISMFFLFPFVFFVSSLLWWLLKKKFSRNRMRLAGLISSRHNGKQFQHQVFSIHIRRVVWLFAAYAIHSILCKSAQIYTIHLIQRKTTAI